MAGGAKTGSVCTKCSDEPRSKGSAWGRACLASARKVKRDATRDATHATPDATDHATSGADATRDATRPRESRLATLIRENESYRAEIASLKRRLADRPAEARAVAVDVGFRSERIPSIAASQNASKATVTPHGPRCTCIGCRSARAEAGA